MIGKPTGMCDKNPRGLVPRETPPQIRRSGNWDLNMVHRVADMI